MGTRLWNPDISCIYRGDHGCADARWMTDFTDINKISIISIYWRQNTASEIRSVGFFLLEIMIQIDLSPKQCGWI